MISVDKNFNLSRFEQLVAEVGRPDEPLKLPTKAPPYGGALGAEAALIQLIVTWARAQLVPTLHTYIEEGDRFQSDLETFAAETHGIVSLAMAKNVVARGGTSIDRKSALHEANRWIEAMDNFGDQPGDVIPEGPSVGKSHLHLSQTSKGRSVRLICIAGTEREYLRSLYRSASPDSLCTRRQFVDLVRQIVLSTTNAKRTTRAVEAHYSALGEALYELTKNTDDHASTDALGRTYLNAVRGIIARRTDFPDALTAALVREVPGLGAYFTHVRHMQFEQSITRLFELSVFDSGPGLASRMLGKPYSDMDIEEERSATIACFKLNISSKRSLGYGLGLHEVWRALRFMKGMIRIRSGRLNLYRAFLGNESDDDFRLYDWYASSPVLAPVEGLVVTLFLPVQGFAG